MTDSPTSQAMHLAMTELRERAERVAELEEALRLARRCMEPLTGAQIKVNRLPFNAADIVDAVLNKKSGEKVSDEAEFELHCNGDYEASAVGPREEAWREIQHYATQYQQDGHVVIYEVTRTTVQENDRA